jgi:hypothetical protein
MREIAIPGLNFVGELSAAVGPPIGVGNTPPGISRISHLKGLLAGSGAGLVRVHNETMHSDERGCASARGRI